MSREGKALLGSAHFIHTTLLCSTISTLVIVLLYSFIGIQNTSSFHLQKSSNGSMALPHQKEERSQSRMKVKEVTKPEYLSHTCTGQVYQITHKHDEWWCTGFEGALHGQSMCILESIAQRGCIPFALVEEL